MCVHVGAGVGVRGGRFLFPGPRIRWWLPYPSPPHSPYNQSLCKADHLTSGVLTEGYRNLQGPLNKTLNAETKAESIKEPKDGVTLRPTPTSVWRNHTRAACGGLVPWKRLKWSQIKRLQVFLAKAKHILSARRTLYYSSQDS